MVRIEDKPRALLQRNGMWRLRAPGSRPGKAIAYLSFSLKAAYGHWDAEASRLEREKCPHCSRG